MEANQSKSDALKNVAQQAEMCFSQGIRPDSRGESMDCVGLFFRSSEYYAGQFTCFGL
jgi:hypothetical protein